MTLGSYIGRRLLMLVIILAGVITITFFLSRVLPGSPVEMMIGYRPTAEEIEAAKIELGLDKSLPVQYLSFLVDAARGDFGKSLSTGRPVIEDIGQRAGATLELTFTSMVLVLLIGIPLGVISAVNREKPADQFVRAVSIAGAALPVFMVGILLQMLFEGQLGWFPLQGRLSSSLLFDGSFEPRTGLYVIDSLIAGSWSTFFDALAHLVLPVATLTLSTLPLVTRITRNMMMEVLEEEYIRTAHAYGVRASYVHYRYALRATLIPLITVAGLTYGYMLGGTVVVEFIFDWPGLGGYLVRSISRNDFPATVGVTTVLAASYLLINLVVDLLYHAVDPRLRNT
ncbi:ABC transporter permease [Hoeflea sp. WL0058]|uniref:ABC transporter permease n=1 Tax=Flavimaribacter sediminis TaxID=2865987 RepID=A0AAE3D161_9HYPH|nr:ABC transporter permease [Flavimaribacter sediminis]MBW8637566.1 ABC transporter permease [Flavimaribacter sediminis]